MHFPIICIIVALTGVIADTLNDPEQCGALFHPGNDLVDGILEFRGMNDMETFCPNVLDSLDCIDRKAQEMTGLSLDELEVVLAGSRMARFFSFIRNIKNLFEDMCDTDSQLNKDYKEHFDCISGINSTDSSNETKGCLELVQSLHEASNDSEDDSISDDQRCATKAYDAACRGVGIHVECGENAFDTYMEVIRRSTIIRNHFCGEGALEEAKAKFFANLEEDSPKWNLYTLAFDLRRRRK